MRRLTTMRPTRPSSARRARGTVVATVLAMCATALAFAGAQPASAAQATGNDVPVWSNGWSWTYATTFNYADPSSSTNATITENVTYTVNGSTVFGGQDAYQLGISGNITGGSGSTQVDNVGKVDLTNFSGSVSGSRIVRKSDLALLQEQQTQNLKGTAKVSIISQGITATINLTLTPSPGWRTHDFPLNPGDSWNNDESVAYTGGFSYNAGSIASGSSPFDGTFPFTGRSTVTNETVSVPIGSVSTNAISASSTTSDGTVTDNIWWSPAHKNDAKEHLQLPLDGAQLKIDRNLSAASIPAPAAPMTATITPSLTCAGGQVTVAGKLGNATGTPVTVTLDKSQLTPGAKITTSTTTGANGTYSTTLQAPAENDGLGKNGSRANWGVIAAGGGTSAAATLVVTPKDCTTLAYTGETAAPRGTTAVLKAQLTDLAGGSAAGNKPVKFTLGGNSVTVNTNGSGLAVATLPVGDTVGSLPVKAEFAGTTTMEPASDATTFAVGKVDTITSVSPSAPSVDVGDQITFSADVDSAQSGAGTPAGSVQFMIDGAAFGAPVALVGGSATSAAISYAATGTHHVQAVYAGNGDFNASSSGTAAFTVMPQRTATSTTLVASPTTSVSGQDVTLTATVAPVGGGAVPSGDVTFRHGATVLGSGAVDPGTGRATLTTGALPVGSDQLTAVYGGDAAYRASTSSPQTVTVGKADSLVDVTSAKTPTVTGEAVDVTAAVSAVAPGAGTPSGTVQLEVDGSPVGSPAPLVNGTATFPAVTSLGAGTHTITARYAGDDSFTGDTDSLQQVVEQAGTTTTVVTSPEVTNEGTEFTITAAVVANAPASGDPDGTVSFTADGDPIGTAAVEHGRATITSADLPPGNHAIAASYSGSDDYAASTSDAVNHTVIEGAAVVPTTLQLSSSKNPATYGELIAFTAQVAADDGTVPVGGVQFSVDGTDVGGPVPVAVDGLAVSPALAAPDPGDHTVFASFVAGAGYSGSGSVLTQTVQDATVTIALSSSDEQSDYGQGVTFTAQVTSDQVGTDAPTGFVQFRVDGAPLGGAVPIHDGSATSPSVTDLAPGSHTVTATYSGSAYFEGAVEALTQQVAKIGTTTSLAVSASSITYGQGVDLTAAVTPADDALGVPSGTVTFTDGTTTLATAPVGPDGTARATATALGGGTHAITATYSGSAAFAGSTSAAKQVSVAKMRTSLEAEAAVVKLIPLGLPLGMLKVSLRGDGGQPLAGMPVQFRVGGSLVCTVGTDANGVATCNAFPLLLNLVLFNGYTASFAGDADHLPASDRGTTLK
jgi:hypothetical protein